MDETSNKQEMGIYSQTNQPFGQGMVYLMSMSINSIFGVIKLKFISL